MKQLFILLLSLPTWANAQDCHLKKEIDKFSQQPKWTTGLVNFRENKSPFSLSIDATATDIDFLFALSDPGGNLCFDDASNAVITFDSTRLKLTIHNSGTMNCDGYFHFNFRNTQPVPGNLERLSTLRIAAIKFTHNNTVTQVTLNPDQKLLLQNMVKCIMQQAPSLIKQ